MPPSKGSALVRGDEAMRLSDEKLRRTEIDAVTAYQYYARYGVLPTSAGLDAIERIAPLIAEVRAHRELLATPMPCGWPAPLATTDEVSGLPSVAWESVLSAPRTLSPDEAIVLGAALIRAALAARGETP